MKAWALYLDAPLPFTQGVHLQERLAQARAGDTIPDTVLFLEHPRVITLGARGRNDSVLLPPEELNQLGIEVYRASRGGDVTYHAPGQLVMYPILHLGDRKVDAHGYLHNLEEIAIRTASDVGVRAFRRKGMNGAWAAEGKIAAIGFRLKRWITMHGMSLNVDLSLAGFRLIVPCGLLGERVSSLKEILGPSCPSMSVVREAMVLRFAEVSGRPLDIFRSPAEAPSELRRLLGA